MEMIARVYFQKVFSAGRRANYEHVLSGVTQWDHISVWNDCWVSGVTEDRLQNNSRSESIRVVVDLINEESKTWNRDLIVNTFNTDIARKILRISLSKTAQEDIQVWRGEATRVFSVRSAYKLL
ncbi:hypothetical protein Gotur_033240 [Gossypium turneri]